MIYISLTVTTAHMKSYLHIPAPFFAMFSQSSSTAIPSDSLNSVSVTLDPRHKASRRIQQKHTFLKLFYCFRGMFNSPLHRNGSSSIVACVFISAEFCLTGRCLAMSVYSGSAIPASRRHVTI
jgi:hypothetical protein